MKPQLPRMSKIQRAYQEKLIAEYAHLGFDFKPSAELPHYLFGMLFNTKMQLDAERSKSLWRHIVEHFRW